MYTLLYNFELHIYRAAEVILHCFNSVKRQRAVSFDINTLTDAVYCQGDP